VGFNLGVAVDAYQFDENHYIKAGLSLDNIAAQISWNSRNKLTYYYLNADSNHVGHFETELIHSGEESFDIDAFTTRLPFVMRLGGLYGLNDFSASLDYAQNFGNNMAFRYDPELAFGFEYNIEQLFPVQLGYRLPLGDLEALYSVGAGYRNDRFEVGLAYQSIGAFFNSNTKGASFSWQMKFRF
jgi:hypothetical protein